MTLWALVLLAAVACLFVDCRPAGAVALTWDPSGSSSAFGGAGAWNTTNTNWWNLSSTQAWTSGDDAWFTGPTSGGIVTLGSGTTAAAILVFSQTGYTITGNTLSLSGGTITESAGTATINAGMVTPSGIGLTKTGTGTLILGNGTLSPYAFSGGTVTVWRRSAGNQRR